MRFAPLVLTQMLGFASRFAYTKAVRRNGGDSDGGGDCVVASTVIAMSMVLVMEMVMKVIVLIERSSKAINESLYMFCNFKVHKEKKRINDQ